MELYTIGHSRHPIDKFIHLLEDHRVEVLLDVRSTPFSRFNPQFNKNTLQQALQNQPIAYVYAGEELGGRPKDPACYKHHAIPGKAADYIHEIDYPEVMKRPWFLHGVQRVLEIASLQTTVVMCSEEDPVRCHRHHLIARYFLGALPVVTVLHIRGDGSLVDAKSIPGESDHSDAQQLSF